MPDNTYIRKKSGKIPEGALSHPNRVPEQLAFFDKAAHRKGEFAGYVR